MPLTVDEVTHVAELARLRLDAGEIARLQHDLTAILDAFATLQALATDRDPPFTPLDEHLAPWRDDVVATRTDPDALLAGVPDRRGRLVHVPKIIE